MTRLARRNPDIRPYLRLAVFVLLLSSVSAPALFARQPEVQDVVYLKDGGIIRGTIVEQRPGQSMLIRTREGNVFRVNLDQVDRITREPPPAGVPGAERGGGTTNAQSGAPSRWRASASLAFMLPFTISYSEQFSAPGVQAFSADVKEMPRASMGVTGQLEYAVGDRTSLQLGVTYVPSRDETAHSSTQGFSSDTTMHGGSSLLASLSVRNSLSSNPELALSAGVLYWRQSYGDSDPNLPKYLTDPYDNLGALLGTSLNWSLGGSVDLSLSAQGALVSWSFGTLEDRWNRFLSSNQSVAHLTISGRSSFVGIVGLGIRIHRATR